MSILNVNHAALRVRDLKKAVHFYRDLLGIPTARIIGPVEDPRIVFLQGIELSAVQPGSEEAGFSHLGLEVRHIEKVCEELKGKGITFDTPLRDVTFDEEGKAVKIITFKDPDGNRVELVEWRNL